MAFKRLDKRSASACAALLVNPVEKVKGGLSGWRLPHGREAIEAQLIEALYMAQHNVKNGLIILCPGIFISGLPAGAIVPLPFLPPLLRLLHSLNPPKGGC